ncbi:MAG: glycosyltransferase family 2 protein [Verrucomicrobiota bacterium]|jgi:glycosyltransferase involved in cell wall biosynthesis|nr:glycosyltransferase family 2 protein [Verrucomicrobiota bacterium]MDP7048528.1 glycosyltransferase family 2 protein [Verrucomicrobiota bacterium]
MLGQPASDPPEISVVMPCLNEAETVAVCIRKALACLTENGISGEIIVADNGSTDGSQAIAEAEGARVVPVEAKGYGSALMGGIGVTRGRFVIMGDADDSYDFSALMPFIGKLRDGCDLVMGNRFKGGIAPGAMPPLHRYIGNPLLSGLGRLFFRCPVGDFHCGLRGFSRAAYDRMKLQTTGMEFAGEMVVKSTLLGLRIAEVPTTLSPDGRSRPPHLRSWRDGWRNLRFMLLFSPRWLFLYPGLLLMLVGLGVGGWLLPETRQLGQAKLDVHTLAYSALAVLLGFQSVLFALYTRSFAHSRGLLLGSSALNKPSRYLTLETGLMLGGVLMLIGLGGSVSATLGWSEKDFGELNPSVVLRQVIPSILALALGFQIVLGSFFLSVLGLESKGGEG